MKLTRWLVPALVIILLSIVVFVWFWLGLLKNIKSIEEPSSENITFVGSDPSWYQYSKACQSPDSSIVIASVLSKSSRTKDDISIIKLSSEGSFLWENKFTFARTTMWDFIPAFIRKNKGHQHLRLAGIAPSEDGFHLLLTRLNKQLDEPFILELDSDGKLIKSKMVKLEIESGTSLKAFLQNKYAYLTYLDNTNKLLNLAKINLTTAKAEMNALLFFKQDSLRINDITANPGDSIVSIIAYDSKKGCSFFRYTPQFDLKEYFRTAPGSEFTTLKYVDDKLMSVIREDSLLEILDLTVYDKPLIPVKDIIMDKEFRATGLKVKDGYYYVCLNVSTDSTNSYNQDVEVRKYDSMGKLVSSHTVGELDNESCFGLFAISDSSVIITGRSLNGKLKSGARVFIIKIKM